MARITIEIPQHFIFSTELIAQVGDINYGGHVGNDKFLLYAHEVRTRFLRKNQLSELCVGDNLGLIMVDSVVVYKSEVFLGDELVVQLAVNDMTKIGFDFVYLILNKNTQKEVAHIKTGMLCFDYEKRKIGAIPSTLQGIFNQE